MYSLMKETVYLKGYIGKGHYEGNNTRWSSQVFGSREPDILPIANDQKSQVKGSI